MYPAFDSNLNAAIPSQADKPGPKSVEGKKRKAEHLRAQKGAEHHACSDLLGVNPLGSASPARLLPEGLGSDGGVVIEDVQTVGTGLEQHTLALRVHEYAHQALEVGHEVGNCIIIQLRRN